MASSHNSVTAFDAKNRLGQLLDRVRAGEELFITRHGQPVAKLVPVNRRNDTAVAQALKTLSSIRRSLSTKGTKVSRAQVRAWRDEGRR